MDDSAHIIRKCLFDLHLDEKDKAHQFQNRISSLFSYRLKRELERILDEFDQPGRTIQLKSLEIDLGEISDKYFEDEIIEAFSLSLKRALSKQIVHLENTLDLKDEIGQIVKTKAGKREIITFFLLTGNLHPMASRSQDDPVQLMREMMFSQPDLLAELLRTAVASDQAVIRRLVLELPESLMITVYRILEPQFVLDILEFEKRALNSPVVANRGGRLSFQADLREAILQYLFFRPSLAFIKKDLRESVAESLDEPEMISVADKLPEVKRPRFLEESFDEIPPTKWFERLQESIQTDRTFTGTEEVLDYWERLILEKPKDLVAWLSGTNFEEWEKLVQVDVAILWDFLVIRHPARLAYFLTEVSIPATERVQGSAYAKLWSYVVTHRPGSIKEIFRKASDKSLLEKIILIAGFEGIEQVVQWLAPGKSFQLSMEVLARKLEASSMSIVEKEKLRERLFREIGLHVLEREGAASAIRDMVSRLEKTWKEIEPEQSPASRELLRETLSEAFKVEIPPEGTKAAIDPDQRSTGEGGKDTELDHADEAEGPDQIQELEKLTIPDTDWEQYQQQIETQGEEGERVLEWVLKKALLDNPLSRLDLIEYFFATYSIPWWAGELSPEDIELALIQLTRDDVRSFQKIMSAIFSRHQSFQQASGLARMIVRSFSEETIQRIIRAFMPGMEGFIVTSTALLGELQDPVHQISLPAALQQKKARKWLIPVIYLIRTKESASAGNYIEFVAQYLSIAASKPISEVGRRLEFLSKEKVDKGERRFAPMVSLLGNIARQPEQKEPPQLEEDIRSSLELEEDQIEGPGVGILLQEVSTEEEAIGGLEPEREPFQPEDRELSEGEEADPAEETKRPPTELVVEDLVRDQPSVALQIIARFIESGSLGREGVSLTKTQFEALVLGLISSQPTKLKKILMDHLKKDIVRKRVATQLGRGAFDALIEALDPAHHKAISEWIISMEKVLGRSGSPAEVSFAKVHILHFLIFTDSRKIELYDYLRSFIKLVVREKRVLLMEVIRFLSGNEGLVSSDVRQRWKQSLDALEAEMKDFVPQPKKEEPAKKRKIVVPEPEALFCSNAGVVILWPLFPHLFKMMGYLEPTGRKFKDDASKVRAIYMLEYVASLREDVREWELTLPKILVGWKPTLPLKERIMLTEEEKEMPERIIAAAVKRFDAVKNSSVEGFRTSFISREGKITRNEEHWVLRVENKSYDMILDKLPWALNLVRLPWLQKPSRVEWR